MSGKYSFHLEGANQRHILPPKVTVGQRENESNAHVMLKLFGYLMFHRPRLHIEAKLHNDNIPFEPDLVELNYEMQPVLWIECGDCGITKLNKLAVKVPDAEIWVLKRSSSEARNLLDAMHRADLRRGRYHLAALDSAMFEEACGLLKNRNQVYWLGSDFEPPYLQFDLNGLWFEGGFEVFHF
jgi:hypothetical protein